MTGAPCDSSTDIEPLHKDGHPHSSGCVGGNGLCTKSLLRLALTSGSAYAIQFTTCVVNVNSRVKHKKRTERKISQRTVPYLKKKSCGQSRCAIGDIHSYTENKSEVNSEYSVSSSLESDVNAHMTQVEITEEKQHGDGLFQVSHTT